MAKKCEFTQRQQLNPRVGQKYKRTMIDRETIMVLLYSRVSGLMQKLPKHPRDGFSFLGVFAVVHTLCRLFGEDFDTLSNGYSKLA